MRRMQAFLTLLLVFSFCPISLLAQSDSQSIVKKPKIFIGVSIPHLFIHGVKLDAVVPVTKNLLAYVSPEYYSGLSTELKSGKRKGYGLNAGLRYAFWQEENKKQGSIGFVHVAFDYTYFQIDGRGNLWVEKDINGQNVLVLEEGEVVKKHQRSGMQYMLGGLWYLPSGLYYECSFGVAVRQTKSTVTSNYIPNPYARDNKWIQENTGISPLIGLRLGFLIR